MQGKLDYLASKGTYHLEGDTLGGRFTLDGVFPSAPAEGQALPRQGVRVGAPSPPDGTFRLEGARLSRLHEVFPDNASLLRPLGGSLNATLDYRFGPDGLPIGTGRLWIGDVRFEDSQLASEVHADLLLGVRGLEIREINGDLAGGAIRGLVVVNLRRPDAGLFNLTLEQAETSRLLLPFITPIQQTGRVEALSAPAPVEGPVEVSLRGTLGSEWRGSGSVVLTRGRVLGLEVSEWRLPFEFGFVPSEGRGDLRVSDSTLQAARGRGIGRAELEWGVAGVHLEGTLRFFDTELRGLLRPFGASSSIAVGRLSGRLDFGGNSIHSVDDLTAALDARLDGSQALELPVLRLLGPYVAPGNSALTFDRGQIRARLVRGVIHIPSLTLSSTLVQLILEGTVTLTGALDLDVRAQTGRLGINPAVLRLLSAQVPAVGPIPGPVLSQATDLLSNRLVHLRVTGNVRNPSVRFETLRLLTDEAVRFFVGLSPVPLTP